MPACIVGGFICVAMVDMPLNGRWIRLGRVVFSDEVILQAAAAESTVAAAASRLTIAFRIVASQLRLDRGPTHST